MSGRCLQVKAVLLKDGVEDGLKEIRRFRVDEETGGLVGRQLLQTLLTRVQSVFNVDPSSQKCTLFWKDEDGDLIQFSSEEELRHAVDNMSDGILRVYVTVTGRASEGSATRGPEKNAHCGDYVPPRASFHVPPPPPPPPPHHPHGPPPPFCGGPWTQFGWKKWKPMGPGGWKGGWKGGMFYGCPWAMGHEGYGCGRKGRGFFKHCWDKKMKKMMKTMRWNMAATGQQNEFYEVRKQVPAKFRTWVRQYVHAWYTQGPEAAQNANTDKLPEGAGRDFPQWLPSFLSRHFSHPKSPQEWDEEMRDTGKDGQMGNAPDCLPPVYFRWLCLFLTRFFARGHVDASDCEEDESFSYPGGHCHAFKQGFCARGGFGWPGKHGSCKKNKGGKHKRCNSSSESEDSDGGQKIWRKVPKGLRKFVRMSFKQFRKGKGDKSKIREKASRAGVPKEVQEFVEQVMLEWNGKLSRQPPHVVAKEMVKGERTLPSGMQREHFQWMVRFMARWDAGKCRFRPGWRGGDSATDESSGEEATTPEGQDCGPCPPYTPAMGSMPGPPFMGMPGAPPHGFGMYPGMDHPFTPPPPPPPPMYGCFPPPPPPPTGFPPAYTFQCPKQGTKNDKPDDGKGYRVDISDSETSSSSTDDMDHVTEGVKKM